MNSFLLLLLENHVVDECHDRLVRRVVALRYLTTGLAISIRGLRVATYHTPSRHTPATRHESVPKKRGLSHVVTRWSAVSRSK
jgi:hypothetical protein